MTDHATRRDAGIKNTVDAIDEALDDYITWNGESADATEWKPPLTPEITASCQEHYEQAMHIIDLLTSDPKSRDALADDGPAITMMRILKSFQEFDAQTARYYAAAALCRVMVTEQASEIPSPATDHRGHDDRPH